MISKAIPGTPAVAFNAEKNHVTCSTVFELLKENVYLNSVRPYKYTLHVLLR